VKKVRADKNSIGLEEQREKERERGMNQSDARNIEMTYVQASFTLARMVTSMSYLETSKKASMSGALK
jgi:hypothetical protein